MRKSLRSPIVLLSFLLVLFYAAYFVRYGIFSKTRDHQTLVIQDIVLQRLLNRQLIASPSSGDIRTSNRTLGCSFLLLEEVWRDCKAIRVPAQEFGPANAYSEIVLETIKEPCMWVGELPAGRVEDANRQLRCDDSARSFRATVYLGSANGTRIIDVVDGRIGR